MAVAAPHSFKEVKTELHLVEYIILSVSLSSCFTDKRKKNVVYQKYDIKVRMHKRVTPGLKLVRD